ncbi:tRNA uracil 4-sulfurtransferase ThiI [Thiomicrorhabdus sp. 6S3-12]|uniref:tRNA uracil 4-sulfurtransferase ThiI n=1 Tax=Thiomicrorhabdus sp. 6S3-12 TaxID=2819681 RepID=UPI001AAD57AD|nr:tRNA uracil 4-sulfurtransferase ThiI [Thiomicrorhabdus sp. 6S3-12]MBO1924474.1 tRNA 4-thiouridine(8) synthase ThiI [Thiomicrorhabdus sp. 6S3-12]
MKFIVKFFPEIMVKGAPVKKRMIMMLTDNLKRLLGRIEGESRVRRFHDKIEVYCDSEMHLAVRSLLQRTPGVQQFWEVEAFETGDDLDLIADKAVEFFADKIRGKRFVVRVKRAGNHAVNSNEIERYVGSRLFQLGESAGVDLKNADVTVKLDLHDKILNVVTGRFDGLGGFPMGGQGEVLSLMSGGFDSTVASYLTMKRGLKTHFIFFNLGGAAHEIGVKQVALYLWNKFGASHRVKFVSVPFDGVVDEIFRASHESYMGVMLKRLMIKAAEQVAHNMGIDALVTGESVAQVSSQTLRNLAIIDEASNKLVLRPLAVMDKPEIMAIADKIGTREFAESMPEYCGVISRNPVTSGSFERAKREESHFDLAVLDKAVEDAQYLNVDQIIEDVNQTQAVEVLNEVGDAVLIDIRRDEERKARPLGLEHITMPFNVLGREFKSLDQDKQYLLYCDKGVMSQLHAQYLRDEGFENVRVYRP